MAERSEVALVTGCSTGIGRATAARLARSGRTVYATARRLDSIADLAEAGCRLLELDVTDEVSMRAAVDHVVAAEGSVGVLVNNAGYSQSGALETLTVDEVRRQFETNVFGLLRMCQLVLPGMRAQHWGRIVNVSSMGANFTFPGGGAYHATKYAVEALSDALRFEVRGFGVDVVIVQPGLIRTEFAATAGTTIAADSDPAADVYADFNADIVRATRETYERGPLARFGGEADDVARVIEKEIGRRRPHIRVRVTASARMLIGQRAVMNDRMWDRFLATQLPRPGAQ